MYVCTIIVIYVQFIHHALVAYIIYTHRSDQEDLEKDEDIDSESEEVSGEEEVMIIDVCCR